MQTFAAFTAAIALVFSTIPQVFAGDSSGTSNMRTRETVTATDFSARKKRAVKATPSAPSTTSRYHAWTGPDPTRGPGIGQLREYQREGRCVIDEGYGRYTFCNNM